MSNLFIVAVTHHGEKLRDTNVAASVYASRDEAIQSLRIDFADELNDEYPEDTNVDTSTEEGLLDALRWHHNVIAEITEVTDVLAFHREQFDAWAGRRLSVTDITRLGGALQHSTLPDTIDTIVSSWD